MTFHVAHLKSNSTWSFLSASAGAHWGGGKKGSFRYHDRTTLKGSPTFFRCILRLTWHGWASPRCAWTPLPDSADGVSSGGGDARTPTATRSYYYYFLKLYFIYKNLCVTLHFNLPLPPDVAPNPCLSSRLSVLSLDIGKVAGGRGAAGGSQMELRGSGSSGRTADPEWMTPVDGRCSPVRIKFSHYAVQWCYCTLWLLLLPVLIACSGLCARQNVRDAIVVIIVIRKGEREKKPRSKDVALWRRQRKRGGQD